MASQAIVPNPLTAVTLGGTVCSPTERTDMISLFSVMTGVSLFATIAAYSVAASHDFDADHFTLTAHNDTGPKGTELRRKALAHDDDAASWRAVGRLFATLSIVFVVAAVAAVLL